MSKEELIHKRASQLQREIRERIRLSELNGFPNHNNDDCSSEEAEEEWNRMYGSDAEENRTVKSKQKSTRGCFFYAQSQELPFGNFLSHGFISRERRLDINHRTAYPNV